MGLKATLVHFLCLTIALVIVFFVTAVLGDGRSVIKLKKSEDLPIATSPELLEAYGAAAPLDALLGKYYGIGLHHDVTGRTWNAVDENWGTLPELLAEHGAEGVLAALGDAISAGALKHPVHFLECKKLQEAGQTALAFGIIADVVAALMIVFHTLALGGLLPPKIAKLGSALIWFVLSTGFFIVVVLAAVIYTKEWECNQPVIPTLTLKDHFDLTYGLPFAVVGCAASIIALVASLCGLSMSPSPDMKV